MKWKSLSRVRLFATPWTIQSREFSRPETGVGSLSLLQGIFPTKGSNPGLLHCRWILYQLSHKGSPRILEWVAYPFFSRSSRPRNWTKVSCIAGGFFTSWAMREATAGVLALRCHFALRHLWIWQSFTVIYLSLLQLPNYSLPLSALSFSKDTHTVNI